MKFVYVCWALALLCSNSLSSTELSIVDKYLRRADEIVTYVGEDGCDGYNGSALYMESGCAAALRELSNLVSYVGLKSSDVKRRVLLPLWNREASHLFKKRAFNVVIARGVAKIDPALREGITDDELLIIADDAMKYGEGLSKSNALYLIGVLHAEEYLPLLQKMAIDDVDGFGSDAIFAITILYSEPKNWGLLKETLNDIYAKTSSEKVRWSIRTELSPGTESNIYHGEY